MKEGQGLEVKVEAKGGIMTRDQLWRQQRFTILNQKNVNEASDFLCRRW